MQTSRRIARLNSLLKEEISRILTFKINDPRIGGFVTITQVSLSPDLKIAKVYFSVYGDLDDVSVVEKGLNSAKGFIRHEIAKNLNLRVTPEIIFKYDSSIARGCRVISILNKIKEEEGEEE